MAKEVPKRQKDFGDLKWPLSAEEDSRQNEESNGEKLRDALKEEIRVHVFGRNKKLD